MIFQSGGSFVKFREVSWSFTIKFWKSYWYKVYQINMNFMLHRTSNNVSHENIGTLSIKSAGKFSFLENWAKRQNIYSLHKVFHLLTKPQNDPGFIFFKTLIIFRPRVEFMSRHKIYLLCRGLISRLKVHHYFGERHSRFAVNFPRLFKNFPPFSGKVMSTLKKKLSNNFPHRHQSEQEKFKCFHDSCA